MVDVAKLVKDVGVSRFLFASSYSLYDASGGRLVDESDPYGRSKVMVERDLHDMARDDCSPSYLRNATLYGLLELTRILGHSILSIGSVRDGPDGSTVEVSGGVPRSCGVVSVV